MWLASFASGGSSPQRDLDRPAIEGRSLSLVQGWDEFANRNARWDVQRSDRTSPERIGVDELELVLGDCAVVVSVLVLVLVEAPVAVLCE
jgi:hypothetical protein